MRPSAATGEAEKFPPTRCCHSRKEKDLDQWRTKIEKSGLKELQSFADGLMKDEAAVRAAMIYDWSNGLVEGKVNKLKMIKRTMFGRAGFGLLRARVLHAG